MPYPSEHSARLLDPERFEEFRRDADAFGPGIDALYGLGSDGPELQSIRFDASRYTASEAREWLAEHDYSPIEFEPATDEGEAMGDIVKCAVGETSYNEIDKAAGYALRSNAGLTVTARIYEPTGVRLYSAPRLSNPAGLDAVAASLEGSPVNYEHRPISDVDPLQGVIRGAWVEDGGIYSEIHLTGDRVLAELAAGIKPGWSVEYTYSRDDCACGSCGASWFDLSSECTHIPGQVVEGSTVYIETGEQAEGCGLAYTAKPASRGTTTSIGGPPAMASSSDGQEIDLMAPAVARLTKERTDMSETQEVAEAVEASTEAATVVEAANDLGDRLAAAEAENQLLREKVSMIEAAQHRAEASARASANREHCIQLARTGRVAKVRELIALRSTGPAELSSLEAIEALVDSVVDCCGGTGIVMGQLSDSAILGNRPEIRTDADLERRMVELSAEKEISLSQARKMAIREVK